MKRLYFLLLIPLLFVLVACSQPPKDEFLSRVERLQSQEQFSYDYKITLEDITSIENTDFGTDMQSYLGKHIEASVSQDLDNHIIAVALDLSVFHSSFSEVEVVYTADKIYINALPFQPILEVPASKLEGKYLDADEVFDGYLSLFPKFSDYTPNNQANTALYKELDEKQFTKDGDAVTLSLTLKDLLAFVEKATEKGDKESKNYAAEVQEQLNIVTEDFSLDSTFHITLDKKGSGTLLMDLISAENKEDSIQISMTFTQKDYQAPTAPKAEKILTQEKLDRILQESYSGQ